jgi:uncharacterized membrane protein YgcG
MRNVRIVSLFALSAVLLNGAVALAQTAAHLPAQTAPRCEPICVVPSHISVADKIRDLLRKYRGGAPLTSATQNLLQHDPSAVGDVILVASCNASAEQALALEQGVLQAQAQLRTADPQAAKSIQACMSANAANKVVAQILDAQQSQGAANGDGQGGANQGGANQGGGGGFGGGGGNNQGGGGGICRNGNQFSPQCVSRH